MLRKLLFIAQQVLFKPAVLLRRFPPGPGAREREGVQDTVLQLHQRFRTRAGHFHICPGEVKHIGGRIQRAQDPVHVQQASFIRRAEPVGQDDLEDISLPDVLLCLFDHGTEGCPVKERGDFPGQAAGLVLRFSAFLNQLPQFRQLHFRPVVTGVAFLQADIDDQDDFLAEVVESNHLVKKHQVHILEMLRVLCFPSDGGLGIIQVVIGEIAGQAAGEGRKPRDAGTSVFLQNLAQDGGRIIGFQLQPVYLHFPVHAGNAHFRIITQEGIASPVFLRLCRLQQEAVGRNILQLPYRLNRRADIRQQLTADRDDFVQAGRPVAGQFLRTGRDSHKLPPQTKNPDRITLPGTKSIRGATLLHGKPCALRNTIIFPATDVCPTSQNTRLLQAFDCALSGPFGGLSPARLSAFRTLCEGIAALISASTVCYEITGIVAGIEGTVKKGECFSAVSRRTPARLYNTR